LIYLKMTNSFAICQPCRKRNGGGGQVLDGANKPLAFADAPFAHLILQAAEKLQDVIPGRAEGASPESRTSGFPAFLDSGLAASRRPGMTAEGFSATC
jgi:hypothetical protein